MITRCDYCGTEFSTNRGNVRTCSVECRHARRANYYRDYHVEHKEERLEKCKLRRERNLPAYREREARYDARIKSDPDYALIQKIVRDWKVDRVTARKMIEEGSFPP